MRDEEGGAEFNTRGVLSDAGTKMPENIGRFNIGGKQIEQPKAQSDLPGGEKDINIDPLAKHGASGPEERILNSFTKADSPDAPRMILGQPNDPDKDPMYDAAGAMRHRGGRYSLESEEDFSRRQPEVSNLNNADSPRTIERALKLLKTAEDRQFLMIEDSWGIRGAGQVAQSREKALAMSHEQLISEGIIVDEMDAAGNITRAQIDSDTGDLVNGIIKEKGYTIHVKSEPKLQQRVFYEMDDDGNPKPVPQEPDEVAYEVVYEETPNFGTEAERKALSEAFRGLKNHLAIRSMTQAMWLNFEDHKADLGGIAIPMYLDRLKYTNEQLHTMFTLPDISRITTERPNNREFGDRMDLALTLYDLVGMSETREKMQEFMSTGSWEFLEETLGEERLQKLVGNVDEWYNASDRERNGCAKAVEKEIEKRGGLTQFGNISSRGSTDNVKAITTIIEEIVEDKDAVKVAYRWYQMAGMVDQEALEIYGDIPPIKTIIKKRDEFMEAKKKLIKRGKRSEAREKHKEWEEYASDELEKFSIPGEPVGSDLSKLIHTRFYRLKDILRDRNAGPRVTVDDFDHLAEGFMKIIKLKPKDSGQRMSIQQMWRGYNGRGHTKLGDIPWQQLSVGELGLHPTVESEVKGLLEKENVNDQAWNLYGLVLWLSGDDQSPGNDEKRLWPMLLSDSPPRGATSDKFFQAAHKYMSLVFGIMGGDVDDISDAQEKYWDGVRTLRNYSVYPNQMTKYGGALGLGKAPIPTTYTAEAHELAMEYGFTYKENAID